MGEERFVHLDFLRALATVAVVFYHCGAVGLQSQLISVLLNWCVPIFVMITGALFLDENKFISEEKALRRYILKFLLILICWGFVYNAITLAIIEKEINLAMIWQAISMVLAADTLYCYQFWYLYMAIGLYLVLPLIKPWVDQRMVGESPNRECKIVFALGLLFSILLPNILKNVNLDDGIWKGAFQIFIRGGVYLLYAVCPLDIQMGTWQERKGCFKRPVCPSVVCASV